MQNKIENDVKEVTKINNKLEKITIENDTISYKLRAKIRQLSVGLYNLYVLIKNKQKEKFIIEIFKIKDMLETKQENLKSEKTNFETSENDNQKWIWPCKGKIVGEYKEQRSDHVHNGIDIAVPENTPVKAIADGKVVEARPATGYGKFVVIEHSLNGQIITSEYGHINKWIVSQGQYVKQGQIIAYSGNTGHSYGPHVHLTIRIGKYKGRAVNPWNYVIH